MLQKAQLPLREQGVSLVHSFHHTATLGHFAFFQFHYMLRVGFLADLDGNGRMRV